MKILLVEDSKSVALPVIAFLEKQGYQVTHAENGQIALQSFINSRPDLVLMDVVMPVMDGIEATRQIKSLGGTRWIPILLMTSLSARDEIVAGFQAGADDYLIKPIDFEILQARIQSMQRISTIQDSLFGVLNNVFEGILTIDQRGNIQSYNRAAETIFGYAPHEVMGQNVKMLMPTPYAEEHDGYLERYLREGTPRVIGIGRKVRGQRKNGDVFPMRLAVTEIRQSNGSLFIGLVSDISKEEAARERIEYLALHDTLTGLPNRAQFNQHLETLCHQPPEGHHAVLFIDLDGFKPINDTLGHEAGDEALRIAAHRMEHTISEEDFIARLGGDEFVAICRNVGTPDDARAIGQRLLASVSQPMNLLGDIRHMGASIGVALFPHHGTSATEILTAADHAMYAAKRQGKGRVQLAGEAS